MTNTVDSTVSIEFGLPNGASGQAAAHSSGYLRKRLAQWADQRNVKLDYTTANHDYRFWLRVTFSKEADLTLFALSWEERTFMPWQRVG
jgi:2-oxoglutarate dehydrogenase complex dehydrogenase (E1) component-like enzyme